jgi:hypothetical protein
MFGRSSAAVLFCAALTGLRLTAARAVIINEVMYHPADDQDGLQYVELFNTGGEEQNISGWSFTHGPKFIFPEKTIIPPRKFLLLCRDLSAFKKFYGSDIPAIGNFTNHLGHHSSKIELIDKSKTIIESFKFSDHSPWPAGPDGYSSSLERICPDLPATDPQNWASSKPNSNPSRRGTPGRANDSYSAKPLPAIEDVRFETCPAPNQPIVISGLLTGHPQIDKAVLQYRLIKPGRQSALTELPMERISGDAHCGRYQASIPSTADGTLIRFSIKAIDQDSSVRIEPSPNEPHSAYSSFVTAATIRAKIPIMEVINGTPISGRRGNGRGGNKFGPPTSEPSGPGTSAVLYIPPEGKPELFDFVHVRSRAGGWKIHFAKDHLLDGMSGINVIFEGPSRWVLSEHLAYELYGKAGLRPEKSGHVRLSIDGRQYGYYLMVEQPNKTFLARTGRGDKGNVYKILWYQQDIVGKHEKKTNLDTGHADIVSLIRALNKKSGEDQWAYIQEQFNVDEVINYFAVNMCIENWDGFFNNYFAYHDLKPGGKWEMIPWDEDKTWGDFDGASSNYDWYSMPLTFGMNGDQPQSRGGWGGGPFGSPGWWRPPGPFSGPLLANPQFRKKLEARLRELCNTVFTEEKFGPVIQSLQQRLRPEVAFSANLHRQDPHQAVSEFDHYIDSFHRQVANRRKFILSQLK